MKSATLLGAALFLCRVCVLAMDDDKLPKWGL